MVLMVYLHISQPQASVLVFLEYLVYHGTGVTSLNNYIAVLNNYFSVFNWPLQAFVSKTATLLNQLKINISKTAKMKGILDIQLLCELIVKGQSVAYGISLKTLYLTSCFYCSGCQH